MWLLFNFLVDRLTTEPSHGLLTGCFSFVFSPGYSCALFFTKKAMKYPIFLTERHAQKTRMRWTKLLCNKKIKTDWQSLTAATCVSCCPSSATCSSSCSSFPRPPSHCCCCCCRPPPSRCCRRPSLRAMPCADRRSSRRG